MIGHFYRLRSWNHYFPIKKGEHGIINESFKMQKKDEVAVFLLVGYEKTDGSGPLVDIDHVFKAWGYVKEKEGAD
jgi:hypothetical protein